MMRERNHHNNRGKYHIDPQVSQNKARLSFSYGRVLKGLGSLEFYAGSITSAKCQLNQE